MRRHRLAAWIERHIVCDADADENLIPRWSAAPTVPAPLHQPIPPGCSSVPFHGRDEQGPSMEQTSSSSTADARAAIPGRRP